MTLILASSSPRRRELLSLLGLPFEVRPAGIDETPHPGEPPAEYVQRIAREKAEAIAGGAGSPLPAAETPPRDPLLVIAADTEVVIDGKILGKPGAAAEAAAMLRRLRGRTHEVLSAVIVLDPGTGRRQEALCRSEVPMRDYSEAEIDAYVASGDPLDKAGAYGIQHAGFHPVEGFRGCYASVMGLPLCHLIRALDRVGVSPAADVPSVCQQVNDYPCPVYREILNDSEPERLY
jgi:septum formation protein